MSAATVHATVPHYQEARTFWEEFTLQCQRHVEAINAVAAKHKIPASDGVQWRPGEWSVVMVRESILSTEVRLNLEFEHWGPKISGSIRGEQEEHLHFYPEEFEFAVGSDGDDCVVAITPEGGSLCPHRFAKYVAQQFRRCFPGISLPSPESPLTQ